MTSGTNSFPDQPSATSSQFRGHALVVGDDDLNAIIHERILAELGLGSTRVASLPEAKAICDEGGVDLVVLSLWIGDDPVLPAVSHCATREDPPVIVVIARHDQINDAAEAMRNGAEDCLFSPFSDARLARTLRHALARNGRDISATPGLVEMDLPTALPDTAKSPETQATFHGLIGRSPAMRALFDKIRTISTSTAPVLISGEVGTGRTSLARALHDTSPRAGGPFVAVDCARLEGAECLTRIESDAQDMPSDIARATNGTLFLDRLDAFDNRSQMRLLALLQELAATGAPDRPRIVASLSAAPSTLIERGTLREDLFFALNVVELSLPPLRMRREDLPVLVDTLLTEVAAREDRAVPRLTPGARRALLDYDWPGNLRELENALHGLVLTSAGDRVTADNLPAALAAGRAHARLGAGTSEPKNAEIKAGALGGISSLVGKRLADIERAVIEATIAASDGSIPRAARVLDVSPSTIYRKRESWLEDDEG